MSSGKGWGHPMMFSGLLMVFSGLDRSFFMVFDSTKEVPFWGTI